VQPPGPRAPPSRAFCSSPFTHVCVYHRYAAAGALVSSDWTTRVCELAGEPLHHTCRLGPRKQIFGFRAFLEKCCNDPPSLEPHQGSCTSWPSCMWVAGGEKVRAGFWILGTKKLGNGCPVNCENGSPSLVAGSSLSSASRVTQKTVGKSVPEITRDNQLFSP
jgi:hypothetical protein